LREGVARQQPPTLKSFVDPGEERVHPGLSVSQPMLSFALTAQVLLLDLILDLVERGDLFESRFRCLRVGLKASKKVRRL
jgi:hypothetical protein